MAADGLCPTCTRVVTFAINELPRDYVDLSVALAHGVIGMTDLVSATKDLPTPLRINVAAVAAEMVRIATVFAEPVAELLHIDWDTQKMDHARPGWTLQRATRLLGHHVSVLLALRNVDLQVWADNGWDFDYGSTDGIDGALALLSLHHASRGILGLTKLTHELPRNAPCPACGGQLVRENGASEVHCVRCPVAFPEEEYRRLALVIISDRRLKEQQSGVA